MPRAHARVASIVEKVAAVRDSMNTLNKILQEVSHLTLPIALIE